MLENEAFHQALVAAGVPHDFEVFSGKHQNRLGDRVAESLEFFSQVLVASEPAPPTLQPGDADQDLDFDQYDIVRVLIAGKYLTGEPATWGEGDWDGGPGGNPGNPPSGDGQFDQKDVVAALQTGLYLAGAVTALAPDGMVGDEQKSIVATFGSSFGSSSFGDVIQPGLSRAFVSSDLTVHGSLADGSDRGDVDLAYLSVPEPTTVCLLAFGAASLVGMLNLFQRAKQCSDYMVLSR
jgi:hypothetical protein